MQLDAAALPNHKSPFRTLPSPAFPKDFQFDFGSVDATANARLEFSKIRSQLANYHAQIEENVHEAERLCKKALRLSVSPDQFHALKENQQRLKSTYEGLIRQTDGVLDRLDIATALLIEFSTRSSKLQSCIFDKSREIDSQRLKANIGGLAEAKKLLKPIEDEIHTMAGEIKESANGGPHRC
uniref:Uncharacterized protein n=1 Tax=Ditylenchus dipsaci TaxID=166011 RepID=A0A915EIX4_9BILA